jgi:hypothetical protein
LNSLTEGAQFTPTSIEAKSLLGKRGIKYTYFEKTLKQRD